MQNELSFLSSQLATIIEAGVERQLNSSIKYSPFRLFYSLFKKKNPQTIQNIRNMLMRDIEQIISGIDNFNAQVFVKNEALNDAGMLLRKRSYNIGIRIVKKLSVKMAFRAVRDPDLQNKIYNYILKQVKAKTEDILEDNMFLN